MANSARTPQKRNHDLNLEASMRGSGVQPRAMRAELEGELDKPLISIGCAPGSGLLEPTYAYLSSYCRTRLPPGVAERFDVAIYELLSNAMKYGIPTSEVRVEIRDGMDGIVVSVSNDAKILDIAQLVERISRVFVDPERAFNEEMRRFEGGASVSPKLGIVRAAHECGLLVEVTVQQSRVTVSARLA